MRLLQSPTSDKGDDQPDADKGCSQVADNTQRLEPHYPQHRPFLGDQHTGANQQSRDDNRNQGG